MIWGIFSWKNTLLLAVVLTAGLGASHWRYRAGYDTATQTWQAKWTARDVHDATALARREAEARDEEQRRQAEMDTLRAKTRQQIAGARTDADRARVAAVGLHARADRLAHQLAVREGTCGTAAAGRDQAAGRDAILLAELFRRADERAGKLAAEADRSRVRGLACEKAYDTLNRRLSAE
jgi:hypothetical protein